MASLTNEHNCDAESEELTNFLSTSNFLYDVEQNFELGVCLGNGANAAAYDAFISSTGQKCVVKVFNNGHGTTPQQKVLRTLRGEDRCFMEAAGNSNKFVRSFGFYSNDVQQFLFYEKMDCSLDDYDLDASHTSKISQVIDIANDLFVAISHLHSRNFYHKDVHIQNVLMIGKHAKLADLESVGPSSSSGKCSSFDIRAVGYIMCQLITGKTGMDWYPGDKDAEGNPTESQKQKYRQLREETIGIGNDSNDDDDIQEIFNNFIGMVLDCEGVSNGTTAKDHWEYLNQNLSPRFHGRIWSETRLDDDGQGNLIYLDRHRVFLADYASALKSFQLIRGENHTIGFKFSRQRIMNVPVSSMSTHSDCTEVHVQHDESFGTTFDLDGLEVNPPSSDRHGFLKEFRLVRESNISVKICYTLLEGGGVWTDNPEENFTEWNDAGDGKTYYLDRHEVKAKHNYAITGFTIETRFNSEQTRQIRFKYWQQKINN